MGLRILKNQPEPLIASFTQEQLRQRISKELKEIAEAEWGYTDDMSENFLSKADLAHRIDAANPHYGEMELKKVIGSLRSLKTNFADVHRDIDRKNPLHYLFS